MGKSGETLSSLFAPPANLQGVGGVLCAYSADAEFLDQALSRFSCVSSGSRRARGSVDFTLMTDPAHLVFSQDLVPGLLHLRPKAASCRPLKFHDMHAKVALLAFGRARMGKPTHFRILVSTGNWTKASANQFIEMVWQLDVNDESVIDDRYELSAVVGFLQELLRCYQTADRMRFNSIVQAAKALGCEAPPQTKIRFLSSLQGPLLHQLGLGLKDRARDCNYVICGSGFFEQKNIYQEQPEVLTRFVSHFQKYRILAAAVKSKMIVANEDREDQVIAAFKKKSLDGWELCRPKDSVSGKNNARTRLHAKFLFLGKIRGGSLSNCWMYLGSGNLSKRGMLLALRSGGNIEAGVLMEAGELNTPLKVIRNLPVGSKFKPDELERIEVETGGASPKLPDQKPSPIIYFEVHACGDLSIAWDSEVLVGGEIQVMLPDGTQEAIQFQQTILHWDGLEWPRSLEIKWEIYSCKVPCFDSEGNFKRQVQANATFGNWIDQLASFPDTLHDPAADDEEGDDNFDDPLPAVAGGTGARRDLQSADRDFPAHTAMMLVEIIADRNGDVSEEQAADWLHYLRHILIEAAPQSQIQGWQALKVNFLHALLNPNGFAPEWQDINAYRALIGEIATAWGISHFPVLEVKS